ncbi:MAG TPA: UDP-N-acetylenolpyruvoylglucosamine reductase [Treponema sp.]|nr:UDP-N-acetylenolpyruvoylglucosamine reductase [Treponema sp.]
MVLPIVLYKRNPIIPPQSGLCYSLFLQNCAIIYSMASSIREIGENIKNSPLFKGDIQYGVPMSEHTTMKVGGPASIFIEPEDDLSLAAAVSILRKNRAPIFTLGGGSNLVVNDGGIKKAVISTCRLKGISVKAKKSFPVQIEDFPEAKEAVELVLSAGAGNSFEELNGWCAKYGVQGLEYFSGLPGTCGGAAYMNARCYEHNFSSLISAVTYLDIDAIPTNLDEQSPFQLEEASLFKRYEMDESEWAYKKSPFQGKRFIITKLELNVTGLDVYVSGGQSASPAAGAYIAKKNSFYINDRTEKGHFRAPSAGSMFKNNHDFGKPSGAIIDEVGLRGLKVGGAQVAPWHGNIIINTGNATAADVTALVDRVKQAVSENKGFLLETEVIFV